MPCDALNKGGPAPAPPIRLPGHPGNFQRRWVAELPIKPPRSAQIPVPDGDPPLQNDPQRKYLYSGRAPIKIAIPFCIPL